MPKVIRMPKLSDTMEEGTLLAWRKRVGDHIKRGEILADVETDKADMEFESYTDGTIEKLVVEPGSTVEVGATIAIIRLPGETDAEVAAAGVESSTPAPAPAVAPSLPRAPAPAVAPSLPQAPSEPPAPAAPAAQPLGLPPALAGPRVTPLSFDDGRLRATPAARRCAEERSVDLSEIEGSGPVGAILLSDVDAYLRELEAQAPEADGVRATPVALRVATDLGLDLEAVKGSGPSGRITKSDVEAFLDREKRQAVEREGELFTGVLQLSQKRKALIRNMIRSKEEAPHFYVQMDVRADALRQLRDRVNAESRKGRPRLTYTHLIIKASALALEKFPDANATYRPEARDVALFGQINVGLAVDVNDELVAPTVKGCQGKSVFQLAEEANQLIQRARMRKLQPSDYSDGTFTISNLGMFGVNGFYAIITPPQSSILSVGSILPRAIVVNNELAIGTVTTLGLSVDHRVLDGVKAAQFLGEIRRLLENPEELTRDAHEFGS